MQLKSRLVFCLHAHQKVYQLRNILVAYELKELGAALPYQSSVHIPTPFQCMVAKGRQTKAIFLYCSGLSS